jgi:hypothetical protein
MDHAGRLGSSFYEDEMFDFFFFFYFRERLMGTDIHKHKRKFLFWQTVAP